MIITDLTQKIAKLFVSKDSMRPAMQCAYFDASEKAIVLTSDTHMVTIDIAHSEDTESFLIPIEALAATNEYCCISSNGDTVHVRRYDAKKRTLKSESDYKCTNDRFPANWKAVVPDKAQMKGMAGNTPIGFNFDLLHAFGVLAKHITGVPSAKMIFDGALHGAHISGDGFYGVLMPIRLK